MVSQAKKVHKSSQLPLLASDLPNGIPLNYDIREVSQLCIDNAKTLEVHKISPHDLSILKQVYPEEGDHHAEVRACNSLFKVFDTIFFFGLLSKHVPLKFRRGIRQYGYYKRALPLHFLSRRPTLLGQTEIFIAIQDLTKRSFRKRMRHYRDTILHEMLHAYIDLYSCQCYRRCRASVGSSLSMGATGHGRLWALAAQALEDAVVAKLQLACSMDVAVAVVDEMMATGWRPDREDVECWYLAPGWLRKKLLARVVKLVKSGDLKLTDQKLRMWGFARADVEALVAVAPARIKDSKR